jgi:hypothetical protein
VLLERIADALAALDAEAAYGPVGRALYLGR